MSELKTSARLRMMAKGAFTRGDVISADRLSRVAIEHDSLVDQLAAAKAQYNELSSFAQSLQLDSVSDDIALEQLLAKHKGE